MGVPAAVFGIVSVVCVFAAFVAHKLPKFQTAAFKAKPADEQRRSIRTVRILYGVCAFLCMAFIFAVGFIEGYTGSRSTRNEIQAWVEQLQNEGAAAEAQLMKAEESLGLDKALAPERVITAEGIADARKRLGRWSDAITRWEAVHAEQVLQAEARIPQFKLSQSEREEMLASFRRARDEVRPLISEYIRAKRDIIGAIGEKLDLIQSRLGKVKVKNEELVFPSVADAKLGAAIDRRFEAAAAREEAAAKKLAARAQATQQKSQTLFGK